MTLWLRVKFDSGCAFPLRGVKSKKISNLHSIHTDTHAHTHTHTHTHTGMAECAAHARVQSHIATLPRGPWIAKVAMALLSHKHTLSLSLSLSLNPSHTRTHQSKVWLDVLKWSGLKCQNDWSSQCACVRVCAHILYVCLRTCVWPKCVCVYAYVTWMLIRVLHFLDSLPNWFWLLWGRCAAAKMSPIIHRHSNSGQNARHAQDASRGRRDGSG